MAIALGIKQIATGHGWYGKYYYSNYPKVFIKDDTVIIDSLVDEMIDVLVALNTLANRYSLKGFVITSGNDYAGHMKGSYHYKNRAVDISFGEAGTKAPIKGWYDNGVIMADFRQMLNSGGQKKFDVIIEGNHIHVEYDPAEKEEESSESPSSQTVSSSLAGTQDNKGLKKTEPIPILYVHKESSYHTLDELIDAKDCIFNCYDEFKRQNPDTKLTRSAWKTRWKSEIENFKWEGQTNRQRIEALYIDFEDDRFSPLYDLFKEQNTWPYIKEGTEIYLPHDKIQIEYVAIADTGQVEDFTEISLFQAEIQKQLEANKNYVPAISASSMDKISRDKQGNETSKTVYNFESLLIEASALISVWIYCKALGQIFNVTPFIKSLTTSTTMNGFSDSFNIEAVYFSDFNDQIESHSVDDSVFSSGIFSFRRFSYLMRHIAENDFVWIKFEELACEDISSDQNIRSRDSDIKSRYIPTEFTVPNSVLAGQIYDFMGLVQVVSQDRNVSQGISSVKIQGQSFQKLFNDDEAVFMPLEVLANSETGYIAIGDRKRDSLFRRNFLSGQYNYIFARTFRSIKDTARFYYNVLSNTGLLPLKDKGNSNTDLFSSYGNRRTYLYNINYEGDYVAVEGTRLAKGLYQIMRLAIDPSVEKRRIADTSVSNPQGTILSMFNKIAQRPLVEFFTDTYGDMFHLVFRTPPFDRKKISDNIQAFMIEVEDTWVASEDLQWEDQFYTWYKMEARAAIAASGDSISTANLPIVYFPDFVALWGSRCCSFASMYNVDEMKVGTTLDRQQCIADMVYVIESTIYLPFTRKGVITLNHGDRRFKKGTWMYYLPTNEYYYIDGVTQAFSMNNGNISRKTILYVSRGMQRNHFDGDYSYFNIVDLGKLKNLIQQFMEKGLSGNEISADAPVNGEVFKYFCERRQFDYGRETIASIMTDDNFADKDSFMEDGGNIFKLN